MDGARRNRALGCVLLWAASMLACDGDGSVKGLLPSVSSGELTGTWKRTVVITSDCFGTSEIGSTREGIVAIDHIGDSLTAISSNSCGDFPSALGSGFFADPVVSFTKDLGFGCRGGIFFPCCYNVVRVISGTLDGDTISGEDVTHYTLQSGSSSSCFPSSCQDRDTFEWERCPPADCSAAPSCP